MLRSIATRRAACLRPVLQSSLLARPLSTEAPAASKRLPRDPPADFTVPIHQSRKAVLKLREDVKMRIAGREVFIEGPKGCVSHVLHKDLSMEIDPETMMVHMKKRTHTAPAATNATILRNAVRGVIVGYKRKLQLIGVGYRVRKMEEKEGKGKEALELRVGFTHPVYYSAPDGISLSLTATGNQIVVRGVDLQKVGMAAAEIRALRKPNPFTGKGIRYTDEVVVLKQGKKKWG